MPDRFTCITSQHRPLHFAFVLSLLILAGCSGGGGGGSNSPAPPPPNPNPLARFAYVANSSDDTVSILLADNTTSKFLK